MAFLRRQTSGSVVCPSCKRLVGVNDERCLNCGRLRPGMMGFAPLLRGLSDELFISRIVVGACVLVYLGMLAIDIGGISMSLGFNLLGPSTWSAFRFGASGEIPVLQLGRWWTVLSAGWLHGSLLHVGFNMMFAWQLLPLAMQAYGAARAVIVYVLSSTVGFMASTFAGFLPVQIPLLHPAPLTLGASAANLGLLGAMVWFARRSGNTFFGQQMLGYAVANIVMGFALPGIDNWAHVGGFAGGWLIGRFLDPLKPERGDHVLAALLLLLLSAASIAASLLVALPGI